MNADPDFALNITEAQAEALKRLCDRFEEPPTYIEHTSSILDYCLLIHFEDARLTIGIEEDGYAHS
jgi:hypothetical protein